MENKVETSSYAKGKILLEIFHFAVVCFMLVIPWLLKSESDKLLSVYDSSLICPLLPEKLS
jgi:hypothetical protein